MGSPIEAVESLATKLGVRPLAARGYWLWQNAVRTFRYNLHKLWSDTYRVTIGDAQAELSVLTKQEFNDFLYLPERPILEEMLSELRPSDVFYDIGANVGLYSCLAADVVDSKVVAFEPHPKNADRLARNAAINEVDISVQRIALADSSGSTQMKLSPGFAIDNPGSAGHTLLTEYYDEESETVTVRTERGDEFVNEEEMATPTVLKIDTEGTEMDVLKGLDSTLARSECRLVYCEIHEDRLEFQGHSAADVYELLESHEFSVADRSIEGYQPFVRAKKS